MIACLLFSGQAFCIDPQTIKIGLLIQDSTSAEARNGAEMAVLRANKDGGYKDRMFELVVKSMEGPWGTGSKQAVDMIFNDEVVAIVGSHDGRNAHLVEQATTKANITFLSAWSGDPTLSQAFTPWFFNAVPNSNQQADMLMEEIARKKYKNVTVVEDDDYDANSSCKSFVRKSTEKGFVKPVIIKAQKSGSDLSGIAEKINRTGADCVLLFTGPSNAGKIISGLIKMKISLPVYGPLSLLGEFSAIYNYPEVSANVLLLSSGDWYNSEKSEFGAGYYKKFGTFPGATAAYAFDAMMVMMNAVKVAGAEKEKVQKALMGTDYKGATGAIKFDEKGNRICTVTKTK